MIEFLVFMLLCLSTVIVGIIWFDYLFMSIVSDAATVKKRKIWTASLVILWILYLYRERIF